MENAEEGVYEQGFSVYFDGSFCQRTNRSGVGVVVANLDRIIYSVAKAINGKASHLAELNALVCALEEAAKLRRQYPSTRISIYGDNQSIVKTLKRCVASKSVRKRFTADSSETSRLYKMAVSIYQSLGSAEISWIPREGNHYADVYSNAGRRGNVGVRYFAGEAA